MKMLEGYITALVTPFLETGELDKRSLKKLLQWQIKSGIHGILVAGTTGESPSLSLEERTVLIEETLSETEKKVPLMVGVGSNNTAHTIALAEHAERHGAESLLVVTPYYNKPAQEGLYQHFIKVAQATSLPIWLYDVPGRTGTRLSFETIERLSEQKNIVGIKDATGDLEQTIKLSALSSKGKNFFQLGGEDALALPYLAAGGDGCISVTSNVAPYLCVEMYESWKRGDIAGAQNLHRKLFPLHKAMFMESSPSPAKSALADLNLLKEELRLPLAKASLESKKKIQEILQALSLKGEKISE